MQEIHSYFRDGYLRTQKLLVRITIEVKKILVRITGKVSRSGTGILY